MSSVAIVGAGPGLGTSVASATADVTDEDALRDALDRLRLDVGPIDALVYNAGLIRQDGPDELSTVDHQRAWAINVVGAITAAAHVGAQMVGAGRGTIIFTGGTQQRDQWEHEVLIAEVP